MKTAKAIVAISLFVPFGCRPAESSDIVRQVEIAGSGEVQRIPVESLMRFFDIHARLATRIEALCVAKRKPEDADWMVSDEGKVCQAVASRDRVRYLEDLETMKRMDTQNGDQNAATEIDKAEGK